eukprot:6180134-Pleurochrysis_carterae.AAC.3
MGACTHASSWTEQESRARVAAITYTPLCGNGGTVVMRARQAAAADAAPRERAGCTARRRRRPRRLPIRARCDLLIHGFYIRQLLAIFRGTHYLDVALELNEPPGAHHAIHANTMLIYIICNL